MVLVGSAAPLPAGLVVVDGAAAFFGFPNQFMILSLSREREREEDVFDGDVCFFTLRIYPRVVKRCIPYEALEIIFRLLFHR